MIASNHPPEASQTADWHTGFLKILPNIKRYAGIALRSLLDEAREEALSEVIANCLYAYRRLYERNELHRAFASALVRYAVAQYHDGRRVGTSLCSRDVYSKRASKDAGIEIHSFSASCEKHHEWRECLTDNGRTPVPDQVHFRIEFPRWLGTQTHRNRQIAERLMLGHSTQEVARQFKISPGRISQIRREFFDSWNDFTGEKQLVSAGLASLECGARGRMI